MLPVMSTVTEKSLFPLPLCGQKCHHIIIYYWYGKLCSLSPYASLDVYMYVCVCVCVRLCYGTRRLLGPRLFRGRPVVG